MPVFKDTSTESIGWQFDNTYAQLPQRFYTQLAPTPVPSPKLVLLNDDLAKQMGLELKAVSKDFLAQMFSGNLLPEGAQPLAQAYAGHQFGHFSILGDGRAHLIGEHLSPNGKRYDLQLKGSGPTPYSRRGDGRAALGPMLREYIISEAIYALGIPTTRSLAVVMTGEKVYRETPLEGAILARVASSHLRVGTFEYFAARQDLEGLKRLTDYAIQKHYLDICDTDAPYLNFLKAVIARQIRLVTDWMRVGFIHGVMNTDNMAISGETIDYGPCAFMDAYHPETVFSSIDEGGRYAYHNQPSIVLWNLTRFAEAILPLIHTNITKAVALAEDALQAFEKEFEQQWLSMMRSKLGLISKEEGDKDLIQQLLEWMQQNKADFTNTYASLTDNKIPNGEAYQKQPFKTWFYQWQQRLERDPAPVKDSLQLMQRNNPAIIPRNYLVEEALTLATEVHDFSKVATLLEVLNLPYDEANSRFRQPPEPGQTNYKTFCGT